MRNKTSSPDINYEWNFFDVLPYIFLFLFVVSGVCVPPATMGLAGVQMTGSTWTPNITGVDPTQYQATQIIIDIF